MSFIKKIREKIGYWILNKRIQSKQRMQRFFNFNTAKYVGILFDATHQSSYITARNFMTFLSKKGIKVIAIGYVLNNEAITYFPESDDMKFFSIKDVNFYYKSKDSNVDKFVGEKFDIMIDLSLNDMLTFKFITGLSVAKFKVGACTEEEKLYYDFMLALKEGSDLNHYLEQLKHYMEVMQAA